jgi:hypothetical protein
MANLLQAAIPWPPPPQVGQATGFASSQDRESSGLVLASRGAPAVERVSRLPASALPESRSLIKWEEPLEPVNLATLAVQRSEKWTTHATCHLLGEIAEGIHCEVAGFLEGTSQYAGVRFPLAAPCMLRMDLTLRQPENILAVYLDGHDAQGERVLRWQWILADGKPPGEERTTYVLKAGLPSSPFQPSGVTQPANVTELHVFVKIRPGTACGLILHRLDAARSRAAAPAG